MEMNSSHFEISQGYHKETHLFSLYGKEEMAVENVAALRQLGLLIIAFLREHDELSARNGEPVDETARFFDGLFNGGHNGSR